jgi:hypothetical protein
MAPILEIAFGDARGTGCNYTSTGAEPFGSHTLHIWLINEVNGSAIGAGTYSMSMPIQPEFIWQDSTRSCDGTHVGGTGSVTLTEVSQSRVRGSFQATFRHDDATNAGALSASFDAPLCVPSAHARFYDGGCSR